MDIVVSIVMPVYNMSKYLDESIGSILGQSYSHWELIAIDDASSDNSYQKLCGLQKSDSRIRVYRNSVNLGVAEARNRGVEIAGGKYIAFMDADDISPRYRLESQIQYLNEHKDIDWVSGDYRTFGSTRTWNSDLLSGTDFIRFQLLFRCCVCFGASMTKTQVIRDRKIKFDSDDFACEDYSFMLRLNPIIRFENLKDRPYLFYRVGHNESSSSRCRTISEYADKQRIAVENIRRRGITDLGFSLSEGELDLVSDTFCYGACISDKKKRSDEIAVIFSKMVQQGEKIGYNKYTLETVLSKWCEFIWK